MGILLNDATFISESVPKHTVSDDLPFLLENCGEQLDKIKSKAESKRLKYSTYCLHR